MSSILYCDYGHHPYSSREIGSQNVQATTVFINAAGNVDSRHERYDLCAEHAIKSVEDPKTYQESLALRNENTPSTVLKAIAADESSVTDKSGDVWEATGKANKRGEKLFQLETLTPRTRKEIERDYGLKGEK